MPTYHCLRCAHSVEGELFSDIKCSIQPYPEVNVHLVTVLYSGPARVNPFFLEKFQPTWTLRRNQILGL